MKHKVDLYFKEEFKTRMSREAFNIVNEAYSIRTCYPDLSGPELIRLVYWGASGQRSLKNGILYYL